MTCRACGASNADFVLFCRACGRAVAPNENVECENHSAVNATGACVVCGKPVCEDCSVSLDGKVYCDDVRHSQLSAAFTRIGYAADEFEGELIAKNLEPSGIPVKAFCRSRYSHFCRVTDEERVAIYVASPQADDAVRLLKESALIEFLSIEKGAL